MPTRIAPPLPNAHPRSEVGARERIVVAEVRTTGGGRFDVHGRVDHSEGHLILALEAAEVVDIHVEGVGAVRRLAAAVEDLAPGGLLRLALALSDLAEQGRRL
jgi:hypothetical protein